jgi:ComF family protein
MPICAKCGRPESSGPLCATCWGWNSQIDGIRSPFRFEGAIRQAIYELKYHHLRAIAGQMAELLFQYIVHNPLPVDTLVAVFLHKRRLKHRGYNQSELIAKKLSSLSLLPVMIDSLYRSKDCPPQTRTETVEERRRNVYDAFICSDSRLVGKNVLLIDDVCTSGATLEACAAALKLARVSSVWGLTLAREV